ncbi:hypothetical protein ST21_019 [Aeromonas phage ST21]|uniref:Uncharacterized protein n=1 Tax=Aeromonas phage ST21 TaxID=3065691 RepID=A0AA96ETW3_9CAUD|nr:hypothetical protein ST21_019 [Aeromonas phage ST21]
MQPVAFVGLYVLYPDGTHHHLFNLGLGPCGKVVTKLEAGVANGILNVKQTTECGEVKEFIYPLHTLSGRITITKKEST